jgi:hypothetical protein
MPFRPDGFILFPFRGDVVAQWLIPAQKIFSDSNLDLERVFWMILVMAFY